MPKDPPSRSVVEFPSPLSPFTVEILSKVYHIMVSILFPPRCPFLISIITLEGLAISFCETFSRVLAISLYSFACQCFELTFKTECQWFPPALSYKLRCCVVWWLAKTDGHQTELVIKNVPNNIQWALKVHRWKAMFFLRYILHFSK